MKRVIGCMVALTVALSLSSVEGSAQEEKRLSFTTFGTGGTSYATSAAQGTILTKFSRLKVAVSPTSGAGAIVPLVAINEAQLGSLNFMHLQHHTRGTGGLDRPYPSLRILQAGLTNQYGIIVLKRSNIKTPADLRGKTVGIWIKGLGPYQANGVIGYHQLLAYGVDPEKDIRQYTPESIRGCTKDLELGIADAVCTAIVSPTNIELDRRLGASAIPFPREKMGIYGKHGYGLVVRYHPIPADALFCPGLPAAGIQNVLTTNKDLDEDTAYLIVKTLIEHQQELMDINKVIFSEWGLEDAVTKAPGPYHPGAIKYYKERGLWTKEMEEHQKKLLEEFAKIEKSPPKK